MSSSFSTVRYLILSDIHANWEALVGYGADPNRVVEWARAELAAIVRGNHDKASVGLTDLEWFNPTARDAARWTEAALTPENSHYLRGLPQGPLSAGGFQILHGSPLDEDEYVVTAFSAGHLVPYLESAVSFFGHTHLQGGFLCRRHGVRPLASPLDGQDRLVTALEPETVYLINPGSVGQPRDGDPRAAYAIYDPDAGTVEYRRAAYSVGVAQAKIRRAGLPDLLADRLALGV